MFSPAPRLCEGGARTCVITGVSPWTSPTLTRSQRRLQVLSDICCDPRRAPVSGQFVTGPLAKAVAAEGVSDIMNVTLVPFGNARYPKGGKLTCQHGSWLKGPSLFEHSAPSAPPDRLKAQAAPMRPRVLPERLAWPQYPASGRPEV